jgi:hypothetical protein
LVRALGISEADYIASLDLIQEAALEPAAWMKVLRQLARLTDCVAGGLTVDNPHGLPCCKRKRGGVNRRIQERRVL